MSSLNAAVGGSSLLLMIHYLFLVMRTLLTLLLSILPRHLVFSQNGVTVFFRQNEDFFPPVFCKRSLVLLAVYTEIVKKDVGSSLKEICV